MRPCHGSRFCLMALLVFAVAWTAAGAEVSAPPRGVPASSCPDLEAAATALAEGRLAAAQEGFEKSARDQTLPPFLRGLAWFGVAETALARKDPAGAVKIWQGIAADASLPQAFRDAARRRIAEAERVEKGLPPRDPAIYREKLPALPEASLVLHVAPGGSQGDGSAGKPFATLEQARDAVRAIKRSHGGKLPQGGVRVVVRGGEYSVRHSFKLAHEDSGTADAPVVYQAEPGTRPVFSGGTRIAGWRPISNPKLLERLDAAIRDQVLEADLKAQGVSDLGDPTALRRSPELFHRGVPQTLARWPNEGFVKTGEILGKNTFRVWGSIAGCKDGKFRYVDDRPGRWAEEPDPRLYGYWFWDWFEEYQKVASIDPAARIITLAPPYSQYGYRKDQRYFGVNLFCELDRRGEWYLDRRDGMVYWLPPADFDPAKTPATLSVLAEPFLVMENVEHVALLGLTFQEGRGDGIHLRGGADCLIAGCTMRQLGGDAIVIEGGSHHGIFGCTMHTLGCGGARVVGGNRKTLAPGRHFVENSTVSGISRIKRTYTPAVFLDGCGNRVAHNVFQRIPSSALRVEGNDHLIELNVIRHVVEESDDQGGLDMWGNPLYRGVVIRWNHWLDIRGGTHCGAAGVRLDDMISGVAVHGNLFERCGDVLFGGVQIHGGKENLVDGNCFLDCRAGVSFSRWGEKRWLAAIDRFLADAQSRVLAGRYPELAAIKSHPDVNFVSRNLFVRCKDVFLRDGGTAKTALNHVGDSPDSVKSLSDAETARREPNLRRILWEPIPVEEMGTYPHPWTAPVDF